MRLLHEDQMHLELAQPVAPGNQPLGRAQGGLRAVHGEQHAHALAQTTGEAILRLDQEDGRAIAVDHAQRHRAQREALEHAAAARAHDDGFGLVRTCFPQDGVRGKAQPHRSLRCDARRGEPLDRGPEGAAPRVDERGFDRADVQPAFGPEADRP